MILKKNLIRRAHKRVAIALFLVFGWSSGYASNYSCTLSVCRAKGPGYDCHAIDGTPDWECRLPSKPAPAPAPDPSPTKDGDKKTGATPSLGKAG